MQGRNRDQSVEDGLDTAGEGEGEGGEPGEQRGRVYLSRVKQPASGKLLYGPRGSAACSVKEEAPALHEQEGRAQEEGIYVYEQLIHVIVQHT